MRRGGRRLVAGAVAFAGAFVGWTDGPSLDGTLTGAVSPISVAGDFSSLSRLRVDPPITADSLPPPPAPPAPGEIAVTPPPEVFDAPAPPPPPPPRELRRARFDGVVPAAGTWAVMIGIDDYPGARYDLRSAVNDVEDVNAALAQLGVPGSQRLLVRNGQATAGTIRTALDWLVAHAGPDAVAVVFYAGHVRQLGGGTEVFVGADGATVSDGEVAARLGSLQAKRAWIGIAACYSGGFTEVLAPGRVLTAASKANELAYENDAFGRSYLVEYMVRRGMLEKRAPLTVEGAFAWASAEVRRDYPHRVPVQFDQADGDIDLRQAAPSRSSSPPPSPSSPPPSSPPPGGGGGATPPPRDSCSALTLGVVKCGSGGGG